MVFHVLTLFPQMITEASGHSIIGRAVKAGLIDVRCVNIRDFAVNRHGQVDDAPYGGGAGMVMMAQPVFDAHASLNTRARVVYLSPQGRVFNQRMAEQLAREQELVLLCGHYEGLDERVLEEMVTDEISVGDYVLTGGELAALIVIDAVSRLTPGVLGKEASHQDESFSGGGLLEYPQYTRPPFILGRAVPPVLLSGHHQKVDEWRREQSLTRTRRKRPDLYALYKKEAAMVLTSCEPKSVFRFFEEISQIPRGSGNEKGISDYVAAFARGKGLEVVQDTRNNLVIYKPGTPGLEDHEPLILQGHMDMVCEKNKGTVHDFLKDPIKLRVDNDMISAEGTTLGADNGIAVALCMALLEADDIAHPPLEILLTTDEEAGMSGVENLDAGLLSGRRMINMDTVTEGTFITGCAGGVKVAFNIPAEWEDADGTSVWAVIEVKGLKGGHSGEEIHNERGNSIRILSRVLRKLDQSVTLRLAELTGGMKLNAIPREAEAVFTIGAVDYEKANAVLEIIRNEIATEYRVSDPGLKITLRRCEPHTSYNGRVLTHDCGLKVLAACLLLPCGVKSMSMDILGMVESSCNIGVLETSENEITLSLMPRSSVASRVGLIKEQISVMGECVNANVVFTHEYPAWAYEPDSKLRQAAVAQYRTQFGKEPIITAIHAGLECGIMAGKIPGLDIISFGPDAWDLHTPDEHLSISSTARVWEFLSALLKTL